MRIRAALLGPVLLAIAAAALASGAAGAVSEWYVNMKYGFSIAYPTALFLPQEEAADGSGQKFRSKDAKALVSVYGQDARENSTLTSFYNETLHNLAGEGGWKILHKSIRGDAFILQGTNGTASFYKKVVFKARNRQFVIFEAVYDASRSKQYEPVLSSMAGSLKILQSAAAAV